MLSDVQAAIAQRPSHAILTLLFDFDGTLAEFDPDPSAPVLSPERRDLLASIAGRPGVSVGIVSGRRLDDLRHRTRLSNGVYLVGLHGLEGEVADRRWQHPELSEAHRRVRGLTARLATLADQVPGLLIEDKSASVAVHVRGVSPERRDEAFGLADREAALFVETGVVRPLHGHLVIEYLPNIFSHKGDATRWIAADVEAGAGRPAWVAFFGDDITDEDAFRAIVSGTVRRNPRTSATSSACRDRASGSSVSSPSS